MFGLRSDGKKVKDANAVDRVQAFFVQKRSESINYLTLKLPCEPLDDFIAKQRKDGNKYSYMHLIIATLVRVFYIRKKMNRFVSKGVLYQRNDISIAMDINKKLEDDGERIPIKFMFTGKESLPQVFKLIEKEIEENITGESVSQTSVFAKKTAKKSSCLIRLKIAILKWLDKHGLLSKSKIKISPFHASCFFSNLKSIKLGYIYHHLYDFGTTSIYITMGKEKVEPAVIDNKELSLSKDLTLGMSVDDRIADGIYMEKTLRLIQEILANPDTLMQEMPDDGSIPKKVVKKKVKPAKKVKKIKSIKEKQQKIKPRKNKIKHDEKLEKARLKKEKKLLEKSLSSKK